MSPLTYGPGVGSHLRPAFDPTALAAALLGELPANRTLGLSVTWAVGGEGRAALAVDEPVHNVIGTLHASGVIALVDAAALAAVISVAPDELTARRLQPLGIAAALEFLQPVRGVSRATCRLDPDARLALSELLDGSSERARFTTRSVVSGEGAPKAAEGTFDWVVRLAPDSGCDRAVPADAPVGDRSRRQGTGRKAPRIPSLVEDLPLTCRAFEFATARHREQRREADQAPFVLHPLEVAQLLRGRGYPDPVVAAAVLHDIVEDTGVETAELQQRFGPEVARLVGSVTEPSTEGSFAERKSRLREAVADAGEDTLMIYAADKVAKTRELRMTLARSANRRPDPEKLDHYWASLTLLERRFPAHPLVKQLRFELEALDLLPPQVDGTS